MDASTVSFFASACVVVLAGLSAVAARDPRRSLAGVAIALAGLVVPLVQLRAPMVAGLVLFADAVVIALLGGLHTLAPEPAKPERAWGYWSLAGLGLLGFVWVLFATGSRQVVEPLAPLDPDVPFGDGTLLLATLTGEHVVASLLVGALALCSVIAAVLSARVEEAA
jgi:NADH:ubiquinone oxidoreductase subunit 6 (subunit J)